MQSCICDTDMHFLPEASLRSLPHILQTAKALARLHLCAVSHESLLVACVISAHFSCAGSICYACIICTYMSCTGNLPYLLHILRLQHRPDQPDHINTLIKLSTCVKFLKFSHMVNVLKFRTLYSILFWPNCPFYAATCIS